MVVTRFNPSANGALHLGHIYTLLVNERYAHENDGKFYVRFDDVSQAIRIEMAHPERVPAIIEGQREIIEWMGVPVDGWSIESDTIDEIRDRMFLLRQEILFDDPFPHYLPTYVRMAGMGWQPYPYTPIQTAERVMLDHDLGVTHVIRGEEFATEYSFYRFWCDAFNYPFPHFIFLPRLMGPHGDISKTNGGYTIAELRARGCTPQDIRLMLGKACLNYFGDEWSLWNLKREPRLNI